MKYLLILTVMLCTLFLSAQEKGLSPISNADKATGQTYAVVVGISDYQDEGIPDLRFADKDAEAFAGFLQSPAGGSLDEDHLKVLLNEKATAAQFAMSLDWLWDVVKENDQVIIYFSGHGDVERKSLTQPGYLLCWDAPSHVYMAGGAFNVRDLNDVISTLSIQNKAQVILITDACRSGKLSGSSIGGAQATAANLSKQFHNEIKILSCQPDEYSIEGEQWGGGRGAFSYHLLDGLVGMADGDEDLEVDLKEIGRYLEDNVTEEVAPQSQNPMIIGSKTQKLTLVSEENLAALKEGRMGQMQTFAATESRGIEDDVLAEADSSVVEMYLAFKESIGTKNFLEPSTACTEYYYSILIHESQLEKLHSSMSRNYAAALQDDAQQMMNNWMKNKPEHYFESGDYKGRLSRKVFSDKIKAFPEYIERAAELLGENHYMYKTLQARKHFFKGYIMVNPDKSPNKQLGNSALKEFRQALHFQPELPHVYWQMMRVHAVKLVQPDSAEIYAQKAYALNSSWLKPYTDLAFLFSVNLGIPDRAKLYLEKAEKIDSSSALVSMAWGSYFYRLNKYSKAHEYFEKAIQIDSNYVEAYNLLGAISRNGRRYIEAEINFKKAIEIDSTFIAAYCNLGLSYENQQRYDEAEKYYKKAIELDSNYVYAYNALGSLYRYHRIYDEAERYLQKAVEIDSMYKLGYNALGNLYHDQQRYDEAEKFYKKAILIDPTYRSAYVRLGLLFLDQKRYDEAENNFKKVIELDPTNNLGYYIMASLNSLKNQPQEAFELLEQSIKLGNKQFDYMNGDSNLSLLREQKEKWEQLMKKHFPDQVENVKE